MPHILIFDILSIFYVGGFKAQNFKVCVLHLVPQAPRYFIFSTGTNRQPYNDHISTLVLVETQTNTFTCPKIRKAAY